MQENELAAQSSSECAITTVPPAEKQPARTAFQDWFREGARVLAFRAPRWERLHGSPVAAAILVLITIAFAIPVQRLYIDGPATFYWTGLLNGWAATVLWIWTCWLVVRSARSGESATPAAGTLATLGLATGLMVSVIANLVFLVLRQVFGAQQSWSVTAQWAVGLTPVVWSALTSIRLMWRIALAWSVRLVVVLTTIAGLTLITWFQPMMVWWPDRAAERAESVSKDVEEEGNNREDPADRDVVVDEAVLALQPKLIDDALKTLPTSRSNRVEVYAVTYAPYALEDVFMKESAVVAKAMDERFGAGGRTVQLVFNRKTSQTLPWATHTNLRKTIERMAQAMDRDKDVLFLHLTSHGGKDARLATEAWPLTVEPLTPELLRQWLDEAGIRWRVISISACYSGSWIAPLASDDTLVMTAADADHTSYGCGSRSPLTFFGQAMYVDALKTTWSFSEAHAKARELIEIREKEAGKTDGYSNPQIREGAAIQAVLRQLATQQQGGR